jgi:hypothetical protein
MHDLRHTAASWMVMGGVDLYTVATILGHQDLKTTKRYAHLAPSHLREAILKVDIYQPKKEEPPSTRKVPIPNLIPIDHPDGRSPNKAHAGPATGFLHYFEGLTLRMVEAETIMQALEAHRFNQTATAKALGISRTTLVRKMERYGIKQAAIRSAPKNAYENVHQLFTRRVRPPRSRPLDARNLPQHMRKKPGAPPQTPAFFPHTMESQ